MNRIVNLLLVILFTLTNGCTQLPPIEEEQSYKPLSNNEEAPNNEDKKLPTELNINHSQSEQFKQHQSKTTQQLEPTKILSNYRLGKGDFVSIKVFGESEFSVTTRLSDAGTISYPILGELHFAGLTVKQIEEEVRKRGHLYTYNGSKSIDGRVLVAVRLWETLRTGGALSADEVRLVYKQMLLKVDALKAELNSSLTVGLVEWQVVLLEGVHLDIFQFPYKQYLLRQKYWCTL